MSESVKRICHITTVHQRYDVRIFHKECASLSLEYNVNLIVADGRGDEKINNISIYDVWSGKSSRIRRMIKTTRKAYKKALDLECEVFHFHDPEFLIYGLKLQRKGKKVIYDVHEDVPKQILSKGYISPFFRKILSFIFSGIEKYVSSRLMAIITVTPTINARFSKINKKSVNINNYPVIEGGKINPYKNRNGICYIGSISPIRGVREIIQSLGSVNCILHLAGSFSSDLFKEELMAHKNWSKVKYYGLMDSKMALEITKNTLFGFVTFLPEPNHLDAQPNKMFEYMAAAIPVIASNFPLWKEIIEGNNCGICVNPLDPSEISNAIELLVDNPDIAETMGKNGYRAVVEKYNWEFERKKLLDLYFSLF